MEKNYIFTTRSSFLTSLFSSVKNPFLLAFIWFGLNIGFSQTQGANYPDSGQNLNGPGTQAWSNPGDVDANDGDYAEAGLSANEISDYLRATDYDFTIPATATINGITVEIERRSNSTTGGNSVRDYSVQMVKGGVIVGSDYALTGNDWITGNSVETYGGATDLWGTTWTPAEINAANFGVNFVARAEGSFRTARVDYIRITVHYTLPPTISSFSPTSVCAGSTTTVTIFGTNFGGATNVSFNGVSTPISSNSGTQITVTSPVAATTGPISVTTPSGTGISASNFTVNPLPVVSPITGTLSACVGSATTLSSATPGGVWSTTTPGIASVDGSGNVSGLAAGTAIVRYTVTSGGCSSFATANVVIHALPALGGPTFGCIGSSVQLTPNVGGTWVSNNPAVAAIDNSGLITPLTVGVATFTYTDSTTNCSSTTANFNVYETPAIITSTPLQSVCVGQSASFTVSATGGALSYQWYKGISPLADGGPISGAASSALAINPVADIHSGNDYYCVVTNVCGSASTANATLDVLPTPQVQDYTQSICGDVQFSVIPTNGTPAGTVVPVGTAYSWSAPIVTGGMTGGASGSNETSVFGTLTNTTTTAQTATYTVTPAAGTCTGETFEVEVTVNPVPFVLNFTSQTCSDIPFSIVPTHGGGNVVPLDVTYSWSAPVVTGGLTGGTAQSGQTSINQTLSNPTNSVQTATYTVTASNSCGNSTFTLSVAVHPKPTVDGTPINQPVCSNAAISTITMSNPNAVPGTVTYYWERDNLVNVTGMPAIGTGQTIDGTLTNTTGVPQIVTFNLYATSEEGCLSDPYPVTVTVNPVPVPTATPLSQTVCAGTATAIVFNTLNGVAGTTYSWTRNNLINVGGVDPSGTGDITTALLTNSTNIPQVVTFTVTATAAGCSSSISTVTLTVNPQPSVAGLPLTQTVCGGTPISTIVMSNPNNVPGTTYSWSRDNTLNVTGIAASGNTQNISGTMVNVTGIPQTVTFTLSAIAGGCPSFTTSVTVVVNPAPLMTAAPATQNVCSGGTMSLTFNNTNSVSGTTYSWVRTNNTNITGVAASGTGNVITGTLTNNTTSNQTAIFTITATTPSGCSQVHTASVTVYAPIIAPVIAQDQVVCAGQMPSPIVMSTVPAGGSPTSTYQWQRSTSPTGPWTNVGTGGTTYQPPLTNAATPVYYYQVVVTNCGSVTSNVVSVSVVNDQNFNFDIDLGGSNYCSNQPFNVYIASLFHSGSIRIRYSYTADGTYVTPAVGPQVGNTIWLFGYFSYANLGMTGVNNTNANISTNLYITPHVYNTSGTFICSLSPEVRTITIRPVPVATPISVPSSPICSNTSAGIVIDGNITDAAMNFNWIRVDGNANVTSSQASGSANGLTHPGNSFTIPDVLTNNSAVTQTVTYQVTPIHATCTAYPGTPTTVSVDVAPQLTPGTVGPNQTVCYFGNPTVINVITAAVGAGVITYQWESAPTATGPWTPIGGANAATYDPPSGLLATTYYRRVVTSTLGTIVCSVASTTPVMVSVNMLNPGTVGVDQTVCETQIPANIGNIVTPTMAGSPSYQWQSAADCSGPWMDVTGAQSAVLAFSAPLASTTYFKRIITSSLNGVDCTDETNCVAVIVNQVDPGSITGDQTLCGAANNPTILSQLSAASGSGSPLSYQWQISTAADCNSGWSNIPGPAALGVTYDPPAGVVVTTRYRRITTSVLNGVSCSEASNCVVVTANSVTGGAIAANRTVCYGGDPAGFTELAPSTGVNLTYQWQISTTGGLGPWADIPGAQSPTYDAPGPITVTTYFQRVTFSTVGAGICQATSNFVTVFVNDVTPAIYSAPAAVCASQDPPAFTIVTPATGVGTISYQWQSSTTGCAGPWTNIIGATGATYDPPVITQDMAYQVITTSTLNGVPCNQTSVCIVLPFGGKTWNGSVNSDWNTAANWTPSGVPTSSHCVVIPNVSTDPVISGVGYEGFAASLLVLPGGNLLASAGTTLVVTDAVTVNAGGIFHLNSSASLVQDNDVSNIGSITINRTTTPMYRFDYTYWNSPVEMGSYTLGNLSPNTQVDKYYSWIPTIGGAAGNWAQESAASIMDHTKGYIIRAPNSFSFTPTVFTPYTATFTGVPNNGNIDIPIAVGTMGPSTTDDKLNLIGNPYPSAVDADLLLNDPNNASLVEGTIYFWTHHAPPSAANPNPFYGTFTYNYSPDGYASYNATGGATTVPSGYGQAPNGYIASGQSFFAIGIQSGTLTFTNAMRVRGNNNTFFRPGGNQMPAPLERHRVWLNFANPQGLFSQALVGYISEATNGIDRRFDGPTMSGSFSLYSLVEGKSLGIQGRALPFDVADQVPLGYMTPTAGTYTIGIDHLDGLFDNQGVYLEDKLLNVVHDLKASEYSFTTAAGVFDTRFVLRYADNQLSVQNPLVNGQYVAFVADDNLHVSTSGSIKTIRIYDMTGKWLKTYTPKESATIFVEEFNFAQGVYLAKITLEGGELITAKVSN